MEKSLFTGSGVAEVERVYRSKVKASQRPQVKTFLDAYVILSEL